MNNIMGISRVRISRNSLKIAWVLRRLIAVILRTMKLRLLRSILRLWPRKLPKLLQRIRCVLQVITVRWARS